MRAASCRFPALLVPGAAVWCCCLRLGVSASFPVDSCPKKIDCALQRRAYCSPGSTVCGPCLLGFEDANDGKCQKKAYSSTGKATVANIDDDIDFLASLLNKQDPHQVQLAQNDNTTPSQSHPPPNAPPQRPSGRSGRPIPTKMPGKGSKGIFNDALLLGLVISCAVAGLLALIVAGVCWCRMQREVKLAQKADYPAFKSPPPPPYEKTSPGDNKLAQSAQMYHYQHQKQQMLSMEKNKDEPKHPDSAVTSDEENEDGDFTVYECPGLAPTGEMEVKNPLFDDSSLHHAGHKTQ
ncbi:hypothetical protein FKM82_005382 [Ascaphus truei]